MSALDLAASHSAASARSSAIATRSVSREASRTNARSCCLCARGGGPICGRCCAKYYGIGAVS